MKLSVCISTLIAVVRGASVPANPAIRNIHTFDANVFVENIAVRSNGQLLVTSLSVPHLYAIDPTVANPGAPIVHTFSNVTGISGIAEVRPNVFALVTAVWDLANTRAEPGTLAVWTVDFNGKPSDPPRVTLLTTIQNSTIFNGIARHPTNPCLLLAADSALGAVWRVNLTSGAYGVAFLSPLFTPVGTAPGTNLGINGIRTAGNHIYFTNSARGLFGRVPIDGNGNQAGAVETISHSGDAGAGVIYDDIALDVKNGEGSAWIASHPSYAVRVDVGASGAQYVVNDTTLLLNPTSAAFGRGSRAQEKTLYVTNGGEFSGNDLINGGVVAVQV